MRKCPRCRSSMFLDFGDTIDGFRRMWKCLGCGRELLHDAVAQEDDDRLRDRIEREIVGRR